MEPIPFLDLRRQHEPLRDELEAEFKHLLETVRFVGGTKVDAFEEQFAAFCQRKHCVGVGSGTDALMLAFRGLGLERDAGVMLPAHTFIATAEAVDMAGCQVKLCDIDPKTYCMSGETAAAGDTEGVRVAVPVHLYGQVADMPSVLDEARKRDWVVVEDAAQAHGAEHDKTRAGAFGRAACFSFYPGKNLGAMGDGGAIVTNDADLAQRMRRISNHGRTTQYEHAESGVNSRLDAFQAAALSVKLSRLDAWNKQRQQVAKWYDSHLEGITSVTRPAVGPTSQPVWHLYVVLSEQRDALMEHLKGQGIGVGIHYPIPVHLQPAYRHLGYQRGDFPVSERVAEQCLSLPMFPELTEGQVERVAEGIRSFAKAGS